MIISITGSPGSGKSTIAKQLSKKLNIPWYSMGDLRGKMATDRDITIDELNTIGEKREFTDKEVDDYQTKLGKTEKAFVIDGRLSWHFIPNSFKIFLDVNPDIGAERIFNDVKQGARSDETNFESIQETKKAVQKRIESDQKRYKQYYNIDFLNRKNYDLLIDTTNLSKEKVFEIILNSLRPLKYSGARPKFIRCVPDH